MPCVNHADVQEGLNKCARCLKMFCEDCLVELKGSHFCAGCKQEQVKDIQSGVEAGELPLAGIVTRFVAQLVDGLLLGLLTVPFLFMVGFGAAATAADLEQMQSRIRVLTLISMVVFIAYEGLMLQLRGQTLGKMALKVKVVTADGGDISPGQAWIRPIARAALTGFGFLGFLGLADYIPAFFTKGKTALHDLAARTRVVKLQ